MPRSELPRCPYCRSRQRDSGAIRRHVAQSKPCRIAQLKALKVKRYRRGKRVEFNAMELERAERQIDLEVMPVVEGALLVDEDVAMDDADVGLDMAAEDFLRDVPLRNPAPRCDPPPPPKEVFNFDPRKTYARPHPRNAGAPIDNIKRPTTFQKMAKEYKLDDAIEKFGPFKSEKEWKFCEWAVKNLGQKQMDEMLGLEFVSYNLITHHLCFNALQIKGGSLSFHNARRLYQLVDALPIGPEWIRDVLQVQTGYNLDGTPKMEEVELWRKDPTDCVEQLIGDSTFDGNVAYGPETTFVDAAGKTQCYGEMWTGSWWHETQVR